MEEKKDRKHSLFGWKWRWQSGWAVALIVVMVIVVGWWWRRSRLPAAVCRTAPLYPVKLATEKVQLALTSSDIGKAELNAKFADRRAEEIVYMALKAMPRKSRSRLSE